MAADQREIVGVHLVPGPEQVDVEAGDRGVRLADVFHQRGARRGVAIRRAHGVAAAGAADGNPSGAGLSGIGTPYRPPGEAHTTRAEGGLRGR
ncbi:hypothetical protein Axi01nite_37560 [Actinoplanes xinjiangensis]|nr:hypothetical protein Axi01nite_37560 [Actinoplanes xinjiangensis]